MDDYSLAVNCIHCNTTKLFECDFDNILILPCLKCKECSDRYQLLIHNAKSGNIILNKYELRGYYVSNVLSRYNYVRRIFPWRISKFSDVEEYITNYNDSYANINKNVAMTNWNAN